MSGLVAAWLRAHLLTQAVEIPVGTALLASSGASAPRRAAVVALGTALTHPLLWFVWPRVVPDYTLGLATGEALVILVEAVVIWRLVPASPRDALATSAIANAASTLVGWLVG